jgi:hypothetical protein
MCSYPRRQRFKWWTRGYSPTVPHARYR